MKSAISVTWQHLSASANNKPILMDCSGYCRPGQMLAIMGPSGAGKTTLLSMLSRRQSSSLITQGQVLVNNQNFDSRKFFQFGAFVYQNDLLFENLTVRQTLQFAAFLKIANREKAAQRVQYLIEQFQLQRCGDTYVGGILTKGISGGQKKRLCVAIQMVSDPSLIILDEPTSGLDSNKAARLLSVLRKLAGKNHTIIFTIHQPSYLQYIKLDRLILLDRGQTIYQGYANQIQGYMKSLGIRVPQNSTISDFFMMEISQFKKGKLTQIDKLNLSEITDSKESLLNSKNYSLRLQGQNKKQIEKIKEQPLSLDNLSEIYMSPFFYCFRMILRRDYLNILRGKWKIKVVTLQMIMKILLLGFLYMNQIPSIQTLNTKDPRRQFIFAQTASFSNVGGNVIPALISVALSMPTQRQLYYKETDSKKYHPLPYFLSKVISEYSLVFVGTFLFASAAYWLIGFTRDFAHFVNYTLIVLTLASVGNSLGFFCATLFRQIRRVTALTNIVMIPLLMLSGIFNKLTSMPDWSSWLQYLSPFRYGLHLLLQNQYGDNKFKIPYSSNTYDYKAQLGINLSFSTNFALLITLGIAFYSLSFLLLKFNTSRIAP